MHTLPHNTHIEVLSRPHYIPWFVYIESVSQNHANPRYSTSKKQGQEQEQGPVIETNSQGEGQGSGGPYTGNRCPHNGTCGLHTELCGDHTRIRGPTDLKAHLWSKEVSNCYLKYLSRQEEEARSFHTWHLKNKVIPIDGLFAGRANKNN